MAALIELDKVSKSFDGGRTLAVSGATLGVEAGQLVAAGVVLLGLKK